MHIGPSHVLPSTVESQRAEFAPARRPHVQEYIGAARGATCDQSSFFCSKDQSYGPQEANPQKLTFEGNVEDGG